ncbi:MAG: phosphoenolpyruvate--protein phosphotransferase [Thermodesulfobacteriota bacterium]
MDAKNLIDREHLHLKIVHELSDLINQSSGLNTILKSVVNKIGDSLNFDVVSIYILDQKGKKLNLKSTRGLKVREGDKIALKTNEGLTGLVYTNMRPLSVTPASHHANYKYFPEIGEEKYESYLGIPIILHNKCVGVLVGQTIESRHINPAEETLFQIIASRLAGLLEVADTLERLKTPSILKHETKTYQGKGVSSGLAIGDSFLMRGLFQEIRNENIVKPLSKKEEEKRLFKSFQTVEKELHELINNLSKDNILSESEIDIFHAHLMILNSDSLQNTIHSRLLEKEITAEQAVVDGIESIARQFEHLEDRYLREKAQDFRDIGERLLHELSGSKKKKQMPLNGNIKTIVIADEIGPSFVSMLSKNNVGAIITEKGGETSHAVIIAKSLGIPVIIGIDKICDLIGSGEKLIVDGRTGFIFVNPDNTLIEEYENTERKIVTLKEKIEKEGKIRGYNPLNVTITANIGFPIDIELAKQHGVRDVGLFRTEFAFTQFEKWPGVREQVKIYKEASKDFDGIINIRTLDIGADKILPYFNIPDEENPLLGLRAIRFSMEYLDLFKDQVKAILLSIRKGCRFRILLPMISYVWEVETARQIIEDTAAEIGLQNDDIPSLGLMIEVPALVYQLEDYKDLVDFFSVGTNDLIQYLLAVDRNSNVVGHLYSSFHPSVLRMMNDINKKAQDLGKEISICGEMAGSPSGALILLSLGYKNLSVAPSRAPLVRYLINKLDQETLNEVRSEIISQKKKAEIERYIFDVLQELDPSLIELE